MQFMLHLSPCLVSFPHSFSIFLCFVIFYQKQIFFCYFLQKQKFLQKFLFCLFVYFLKPSRHYFLVYYFLEFRLSECRIYSFSSQFQQICFILCKMSVSIITEHTLLLRCSNILGYVCITTHDHIQKLYYFWKKHSKICVTLYGAANQHIFYSSYFFSLVSEIRIVPEF